MTKQVEILYGGERFTLARTDSGQVRQDILAAVSSGTAMWLEVNSGEGGPQRADVLIAPGVPVVVLGIDEPDGPSEGPGWNGVDGAPDDL